MSLQDKQTKRRAPKTEADTQSSIKLRALEGYSLPVVYKGKIVRITTEVIELELAGLPYDSRAHIDRSLKNREIEKVGE